MKKFKIIEHKVTAVTTFKDYLTNYCENDVNILIGALQQYRNAMLRDINLELLNYITISQISYKNALKNYLPPKVELYTISNENTYNLIKDSIYGGNFQVFEHYAKIGENADLLLALDENNLYSWAMQKSLP